MHDIFVDTTCPVNWAHPLNRRLVGRWRVVPNPGWRGSLKLRDLVRGGKRANDGTLTNGPTWSGGGRPNGDGSLAYDGAGDYVDLGTNIAPLAVTYMAWFKARSLPRSYNAIVSRNNNAGVYTELYVRSDGKLALYLNNANYDGTGAYTMTTGVWNHVALTYDVTSGLAGYVNGKLDGSASPNMDLNTTAITVSLGNVASFSGREFDGFIDDACIFDYAVPATKIAAIYKEQMVGSPETLNWVSERSWSIPEAAPAGGNRRRRVIMTRAA